jgi:hypothetical protein
VKGFRLVSLFVIIGLALVLAGAQTPQHAETASVDPSWEILEGEPNSCTGTGSGFSIMAWVNVSAPASEQGTFTVPGFGAVGETHDTNYGGPTNNSLSFFVFGTAAYSVPAHTPVTLTVTTYNDPNYLGGVSYVDTMTWDCTTGLEMVAPAPDSALLPGCDVLMPIPATTVGGAFVADAPTSWAPGKPTEPLVTIPAGNTARVIGLDASGAYYKIIWECDFLWVPKNTMGPNYDNVWNGAPLPTAVVE